MSRRTALSKITVTTLSDRLRRLALILSNGQANVLNEAADRLEGSAKEIVRLERSRADLHKFTEEAFRDHWSAQRIEALKRSNADLGRRLAAALAQIDQAVPDRSSTQGSLAEPLLSKRDAERLEQFEGAARDFLAWSHGSVIGVAPAPDSSWVSRFTRLFSAALSSQAEAGSPPSSQVVGR